ncbi:MAG: ATP-dependent carboxylate-amine ligase, partial [Alphaproteobacteria bacterium]|nr:ATP-dependent carboxylate-amine ligase [Alphaproteobacteria bacterium]
MPDRKHVKPRLLRIIEELGPEFGARVQAEPKYGHAGYIEFPSGRRRFFRGTNFDINRQAAAAIAKDKDYSIHFLREAGFRVPDGVLLFSERYRDQIALRNPEIAQSLSSLEPALDFVARHGFPVFVKPNEGSGGKGVFMAGSEEELRDALDALFEDNPRVLVQRRVQGRDYRVVILEGEVVCAYERAPLSVTGDGTTPLGGLAAERIAALGTAAGGTKVDPADPRIASHLRAQGLKADDILGAGRIAELLPTANLSAGGRATDISNELRPDIRDICVAATRTLGLTF